MAEVVARTPSPTFSPPGTEISPGIKKCRWRDLAVAVLSKNELRKGAFQKEVFETAGEGKGTAVIPKKGGGSPKTPFYRSATLV